MKILVSGLGSIGKRHSHSLRKMGHEVINYDPKFGEATGPFEQGLDLCSHVVIASPAKYHAKQAILALKAGKEVFIEKPMAVDVAEGEQILKEAQDANKTVGVGYQWRVFAEAIKFRESIKDLQVVAAEFTYCGDKNRWPGQSYDDLLLECSHEIDLVRFLFPECSVQLLNRIYDNDRGCFTLSMNPKDGRPSFHIRIFIDWACPQDHRSWTIWGHWKNVAWRMEQGTPNDMVVLDNCYIAEMEMWLSNRPICNQEDGMFVLRIIDGIRKLSNHNN